MAVSFARGGPLRARINIVPRDNMHSHVCCAIHIVPNASWDRHSSLTATIVEQIYVSVPEVTVRDAIYDVVETGLGQAWGLIIFIVYQTNE